jgi:hypothetical protein
MYIYLYIHVYIYESFRLGSCVPTSGFRCHIYIHINIYIYIYIYIYINPLIFRLTFLHLGWALCINMFIYMYIYVYVYVYIYINSLGWDPVFQPQGFDVTYAEMNKDIKNTISHRYRSLDKLRTFLIDKHQQEAK